jgi:hypothetical protein
LHLCKRFRRNQLGSPIVSLRNDHAARHEHKAAYFLQAPQQLCWSTQLFHVEQFGTVEQSSVVPFPAAQSLRAFTSNTPQKANPAGCDSE